MARRAPLHQRGEGDERPRQSESADACARQDDGDGGCGRADNGGSGQCGQADGTGGDLTETAYDATRSETTDDRTDALAGHEDTGEGRRFAEGVHQRVDRRLEEADDEDGDREAGEDV